jgi:RimJ/RimL family protein N-acetyltransferase
MTDKRQSPPPKSVQTLAASKKRAEDMTPEEFDQLTQLHNAFRPRWITPTIQVGPILPTDKQDLLKYLNDDRIVGTLIGPPKPYLPEHADDWIRTRVERMTIKGTPLECAIRDMENEGRIIGAVRVSDGPDDQLEGDDVG